jgi:hypothetical protein
MCFDFLYNFCLKPLSLQEEFSEIFSQMCIGLHVKYQLSCQTLMNLELAEQISEKYSNTKFNENRSSGIAFYAYVQTERQTDMTKPMVTFRNFANVPKIC